MIVSSRLYLPSMAVANLLMTMRKVSKLMLGFFQGRTIRGRKYKFLLEYLLRCKVRGECFVKLDRNNELVVLYNLDDEKGHTIRELCVSKAEEFRMLGYDQVTGQDVWNCVCDKYIKTGEPLLHKMVNDILSLKVTSLMNWMTLSVYKGAQF
jgi:hypothetical protein